MDLDATPAAAPEWQGALEAVIAGARRRSFEWGVHDCVLFAAEAVRIRTGRAVLDIPVTWTSALEAHRALQAHGGLRAAVSARLGEPVGVLGARIGDVALVRDAANGGNELLGVFHDQQVLCPAAAGLARLRLDAAACRWKVGR